MRRRDGELALRWRALCVERVDRREPLQRGLGECGRRLRDAFARGLRVQRRAPLRARLGEVEARPVVHVDEREAGFRVAARSYPSAHGHPGSYGRLSLEQSGDIGVISGRHGGMCILEQSTMLNGQCSMANAQCSMQNAQYLDVA